MRLRKVKIVIQPISNTKSEWTQALKADGRSVQPRGVLVFTSLAAVAKALSPTRLELLSAILKNKPKSIYALAKLVRRDFKNVYSDVRLLAEIGFLDLKSDGQRHSVRPLPRFSGIELDLAS